MKIKQQILSIHQFTASERASLCIAEDLVREIYESYDDNVILQRPLTGECITIDELPRVLGILSFLTENGAVEVNPR